LRYKLKAALNKDFLAWRIVVTLLLPSGFYDLLPPDAATEASLMRNALKCFAFHGYQQVSPPLLEFEESLLHGASTTLDRQTFRVMDPLSQRVMGIRADMTMQIGRIALTRMSEHPQPLRLCYGGMTLNTKSDSLSPTRLHRQVGAEMIGLDHAGADEEMLLLAVNAATSLGIKRLSVDINAPALVPSALQSLELSEQARTGIIHGLANKDLSVLSLLPADLADWARHICQLAGPLDEVVSRLDEKLWPRHSIALRDRLLDVAHRLQKRRIPADITLDLTENRGFDYDNSGISFSLFATGIEGEIARGGRYKVALDGTTPAIGFTLYLTRLLGILPPNPELPSVMVSLNAAQEHLQSLHAKGYATVFHQAPDSSIQEEATRMGCAFWLDEHQQLNSL
jgi:ATP phosphoribosyltransferase regulatory subunit